MAPEVPILRNCHVSAVMADKRPTLKRNHGPELAAQNAIGTTNYCRGHFLRSPYARRPWLQAKQHQST